jgi:two-component system invasion response regulator UvrY
MTEKPASAFYRRRPRHRARRPETDPRRGARHHRRRRSGNGLDAIKLFRKSRCNVLLLDISLPDRNGIEVLKQIKDDKPELAVLMLSMHREDQYAIRSLKAGAAGYLTKQSAPRELVGAIRQVAAGQRYVSAQLAQVLAAQVGEDHDKPVHEACPTASTRP